jgi:hypothetical protein
MKKLTDAKVARALEGLLRHTQHSEFSHVLVRDEKYCDICKARKQAKRVLAYLKETDHA